MMRLKVKNNICFLQSDVNDFNLRSLLNSHLTTYRKVRKFMKGAARKKKFYFDDVPEKLYTTVDSLNNIYHFPRGLYTLMSRQFDMYSSGLEIIDESTDNYRLTTEEIRSQDIPDILKPYASFSLREDQVLAVMKALLHKRGILQMPTGCFVGDTEVVLANGEIRSFKYLVEQGYDDFDVISSDPYGGLAVGKAHNPHITKYVDKLMKLVMDTGKEILCTHEHPFMTANGDYVPAENLLPGDRLMTHSFQDSGEPVIVSFIEEVQLDESVPVYDLTVEKYHNFAISVGDNERGVIVHNSGKTEVMAAIISILERKFPDIKLTVIEPADVLVNKTTERFNKYELNAVRYKDIRHTENPNFNVLVTHPTSLLNDTDDDPSFLRQMAGVFWDECQHCKCDTWKTLNQRLFDCEYALGFSALAVSEDHIYETNTRILDTDEVLIEGATGPVIVNISPKYYIDNDILATPVVLQLVNNLGRGLYSCNDWSKLRQKGIESESRTRLTTEVANMFTEYERRILILVGTKKQAYEIASSLALDYDLGEFTAISFGSGESFLVRPDGKTYPYDGEDILKDFDDERFSIMISTSHMDEGVDISNLDVAILASGGKKDRRVVQRIGRALRSNKTGKYAYIVDFYDEGSGVLQNHSNIRMKLYKDVIQIPKDLIFQKVNTVNSFIPYFEALEGYHEDSPSVNLMNAYDKLSSSKSA